MKMIRSFAPRIAAFVLLAALTVASGQSASDSDELNRLQTIFTDELKKLTDRNDTDMAGAQDRYIQTLVALEKKLQAAGQLDPLLAVRTERERFLRDRTVQAANVSATLPELAALQNDYARSAKDLPLQHAGRVAALADQYGKSLEAVQKKLTQKGAIDSALAVKTERENAEQRPEVKAARAVIAQATTAKPVTPPVSKTPEVVKPADPAKPAKKYTGTAENQIRKRHGELMDALMAQKYDKASTYIDPEAAKRFERGIPQGAFLWFFPFLRYSQHPAFKLSIARITVDEKEGTAQVVTKTWFNNNWIEHPASTWMETEGDWYLKVNMNAMNPQNNQDPQNRPDSSDRPNRPPFPHHGRGAQ